MPATAHRIRLARRAAPALAPACAALALALAAGGCGVATNQDAVSFVLARKAGSERARTALAQAKAALAALPAQPTQSDLASLRGTAETARERVNQARAGLPTYQAAEEELPIAEDELGVGANELNYAMRELASYAQYPRRAALALYRRYVHDGSEQWNNAAIELWRLARVADPPLIR